MVPIFDNLWKYRELLAVLTWKTIALRYKQSYLGVVWAILKPIVLVLVFMLVRSFVGIDSGGVPYPLLVYCALIPWNFFQESVADGVVSVVNNANLVRKIYFPREIFPLVAVVTKLVEMCIGFLILAALMAWYGYGLQATLAWVPLLVLVCILSSLTISLVGAAINVYVRDIGQVVPLALSVVMYASPVIYPLALVQKKLLEDQAAGAWSDALYTLYTLNPMVGVIDGFQRTILTGTAPGWSAMAPGLAFVAIGLPISYTLFKQAEAYFADVV